MPLKDLEIRALRPQDRIYKRADERGLYIEVRPNGSKLWRFKYNYLGKDKRIAFGSYPEVGLAEARRKRDEARQKVRDGVDPVTERKREKLVAMYNAANSFEEVAKSISTRWSARAARTPRRRRRTACWNNSRRSPPVRSPI